MHRQIIESGDLHADLWEDLNILTRHIAGPEDVTVGEHPVLGLCVVSDNSGQIGFEWWTLRPISLPAPSPERYQFVLPDPALDELLGELDDLAGLT